MINESGVYFFSGGGHNHDGDNSSFIDTNAYSLFDFNFGFQGAPNRVYRQSVNFDGFKQLIINTINSSVLAPAGIILQPGVINGNAHIIANSITAGEIAANTITADEIAAGTITASELAANIVLVDNVIRSNNFNGTIAANGVITSSGNTGWAITYAGDAVFDAADIRGTITANAISINNNNYWYANGNFRVGSNTEFMSFDGSSLSVTGDVTSANLTATGGTIAGFEIGYADSPDSIHTGGNFLGTMDLGKLFPAGSGDNPIHSNWQGDDESKAGVRIDGPSGVYGEYIYDSWRLDNGVDYSYAIFDKIETTGTVEADTVNAVAINATGTITGDTLYSTGNIDADVDITALGSAIIDGAIESGDMITAGGTGVYYNASNLDGSRYGIAFGWHDTNAWLTCIVNNDTNVDPYFIPDGYASDRRQKENIQLINNSILEKIYAIKIYEFDYKSDIPQTWLHGQHSIGVMADELKQLFPETVVTPENPEKYSQVTYVKLIPMLLAAVTDLNGRLKALEQ